MEIHFNPTEIYPGEENVVTDALSQLEANFSNAYSNENEVQLSKRFGKADNSLDASRHEYPRNAQLIAEYQRTDKYSYNILRMIVVLTSFQSPSKVLILFLRKERSIFQNH